MHYTFNPAGGRSSPRLAYNSCKRRTGAARVRQVIGQAAPAREARFGAVLTARDATYRARDYRSFEYVSLEVAPGQVHALLTVRGSDARDFLLAAAGSLRLSGGAVERAGDARLGLVPGVNDVPAGVPAGRALALELSLAGRASGLEDVLALAEQFRLATQVDVPADALDAASRVRLGAALACAWDPALVAVDATFAAMPPHEGDRLLSALSSRARAHGTAFLVATASPELAARADAATPMDLDAREAFARCEGGDR